MTFVCWHLSFTRSHVAHAYIQRTNCFFSRCILARSTSSFRSLSVCLSFSLSLALWLVLSISLCAFWMLYTCDKLCVYVDEPQNSTRVPPTHLLVTTSFMSREREKVSRKSEWIKDESRKKKKTNKNEESTQREREWVREKKRTKRHVRRDERKTVR